MRRHLGAFDLRAEKPDQRTHHARADDRDTSGRARCPAPSSVPSGVERRLDVGRQHRARQRNVGRQRHHRLGRQVELGLMGIQRKDIAADKRVGPGLDHADCGIAVFHREREAAAHEGRAHALVFALGNPAGGDQRLGTPADRTVYGAHPDLAGRERRKPFLPDFGLARADVPQRLRHLLAARHARSFQLD